MSGERIQEYRCKKCNKLLLRMRSSSGKTWIQIICSRCKRVNELEAA